MHTEYARDNGIWRTAALVTLGLVATLSASDKTLAASVLISPQWNDIVGVSRTHISIHACPEPPLRRSSPIHDAAFQALADFEPDYARLSPWFPYPKMAIAELRPPDAAHTYWDFALLDEITGDFMHATAGHPVLFNPGAVPRWMFSSDTPTRYPDDPNAIDWTYREDRHLNASTIKLFAEYQSRIAAWYMKGGFRDEHGVWHASGHHYKIDYWEVLNEPEWEEDTTPKVYTQFYDAVVEEVRKVAPEMKFVGPAHGDPDTSPYFFTYFLNPRNHRPGIPIDWLSYHFYTVAHSDESLEVTEHTYFEQADKFLAAAGYIDALRQSLYPKAGTAVDEMGSALPGQMLPKLPKPIPPAYWSLAGATWAYMFGHLALLGVDAVHVAELVDYPGQFASATLLDWATGRPNARYWVAKMLRVNFVPGDRLVAPLPSGDEFHGPDPSLQIYAQAFISSRGVRKVLIVNKRSRAIDVTLTGAATGSVQMIDEFTTEKAVRRPLASDTLHLPGLATAVVELPL